MYLMNYIENSIREHSIRRMHYCMGTFLSIEVFYDDEDTAKEAIELAFNEARRIEGFLSRFREDSQIYKINHLAHIQPQVIDQEIFGLIENCLLFSKESDGTFDITIGSLIDLWKDAEKNDFLPTQEEINFQLLNIGYQNIILDKETRTIFFKTSLLKTDFGAVGKGYALDRMVEVLKENGIKKVKLDFGGHLYYFNQLDMKEDYVGIRDPLCPEDILFNLPLKNQSLSTSANYERNFKIQAKTYGHLINPLDGYPKKGEILSVSAISPSAKISDILSTAVFILGQDKGIQLIENMADIEAIIITYQRGKLKTYVSPKLEMGDASAKIFEKFCYSQ